MTVHGLLYRIGFLRDPEGPPDPDEHCNEFARGGDDEERCTEDGEGCTCDCVGCRKARAAEHDHDARDYDADQRLDAMRNGDMDEGAWE